jgi:cephalosporin hydroxylase
MEAVIAGVAVGAIMIAINAAVAAAGKARRIKKQETAKLEVCEDRIDELEKQAAETKALVKLTLSTCIIIGDGMVQNGLNGDVKKAFCEKKQDALKML